MANLDIAQQRLHNQRLVGNPFEKPEEVVRWLGAVQAQDYAGAKWAVGQRLNGVADAAIEQAFTDGTILRTHVMRPTWHFVLPADIRWLLELTAPRVKTHLASTDRRLELDSAILGHGSAVLEKALQGGKHLTRVELISVLQQAGIATDELRLTHIVMHAELDGIICSGARRGKQHTLALLAERAPQAQRLERDHALAELARRYFMSHGPATLKDYVWWSGLTVADARAGLDMVSPQLVHETLDGQTYWFAESAPAAPARAPIPHLLPNYDEYTVSYVDRSAAFDSSHTAKLDSRGNILFNNTMVIDGRIVGTWKRTFKKGVVVIELAPFAPLTATEEKAITAAARRYGEFLDLSVKLQ